MSRPRRMTVAQYLAGPETLEPQELVWGVVRDQPGPDFGHQAVVARVLVLLQEFVERHTLGVVCISPLDVVLDEEKALVVQPDVVFVARDRVHIIRDRIWGAPDLVVEVVSPSTARRDRTTKLGWYRTYGVRECWLVDVSARVIEVVGLQRGGGSRRSSGDDLVESVVLPGFGIPARAFFKPYGLERR